MKKRKRKPKILITVRGGVAYAVCATANVDVVIFDHDNVSHGASDNEIAAMKEPESPPVVSERKFKKMEEVCS